MAGLLVLPPRKGDASVGTAALPKSPLWWLKQCHWCLGGGWRKQGDRFTFVSSCCEPRTQPQCSMSCEVRERLPLVPRALAARAAAGARVWLQTFAFQHGVPAAAQTCSKPCSPPQSGVSSMQLESWRQLGCAVLGWSMSLVTSCMLRLLPCQC